MKIYDSKTFGEALRMRRKELGYTQQDIANFTGFSVSFLSDLERGKKTAELEKSLFVAQILSMDIFMEGRG